MSRDTGGLLVETHRRSPFSQMKTGLIFPGSLGKTTEDTLARAYEGSTILSCTTSSGYQVGLLFGAGQPSAVQPSPAVPGTCYLVYFYGNGMCLETSCYELAQFRQLGCTVLIPEYPGYGMSSGRASESGCYEAADAAYHYLTETLHAHPTQIVVAGWSLGAAVAIDLAARKQAAGLIVLGAFTNIPEQAHAPVGSHVGRPPLHQGALRQCEQDPPSDLPHLHRTWDPRRTGALCHGRAPCTSSEASQFGDIPPYRGVQP